MTSEINPYARNLAGRDPLEVIANTAPQLALYVQKIGPARFEESYAPGKWSAREILCHLADCEIAFGFRLRQTLAEPNHVIQPFDQNLWAKRYGSCQGETALATFTALRKWNIALFGGLTAEDQTISVTHPERGTMTFRNIIETIAGHDLNHLKQIETIASNSASM